MIERFWNIAVVVIGAWACLCAAPAWGQIELDRADYADRLRGMWLAESIANWTGLRGEGQRTNPPFATDADWGTDIGRGVLEFVIDKDPWPADDDTDIEYVYAQEVLAALVLDPGTIQQAWIDHINRFIWVSNAAARDLMDRGVMPPATGMGMANASWLMIDAQLTTEVFGALAPGMPRLALELADGPIRTTAAGHAAHAAQFHVLLYALAPLVDPADTPQDQVRWLVGEARKFIPDSSKAADIIDFVVADELANADKTDWELTRDRIYTRYHGDAAANGFRYRGWPESSVNLATGVMALLYGGGDLKDTIRIATLSGWDADNPASTMGGLLGLLHGTAWVQAQFPGVTLSDRYWITRTRDAMEDFLPDDPQAEDSFTLLSQRMLAAVDKAVASGGGRVDLVSDRWLVPPICAGNELISNPLVRLDAQSGTNSVRRTGGTVAASSTVVGSPDPGKGSGSTALFANGLQTDFSGAEVLNNGLRWYYSTQHAGLVTGDWVTLTVTTSQAVEVASVRFVEGDHFNEPGADGGWATELALELRIGGVWVAQTGAWTPSATADPEIPFQIIDLTLDTPVMADGVRLMLRVGGDDAFVTCAEIDLFARAIDPGPIGFDLDRNGRVDVDDLYSWYHDPVDLDGDGVADGADARLIEGAVRWTERADMNRRP